MNFIECAWKVRPILETIPATRDDDRKLIAEVWSREMANLPVEMRPYSALDMITFISEGIFENPETITRVRRKLQETIKSLRGNKWDTRHGMEADCCSQLSFFDLWNY